MLSRPAPGKNKENLRKKLTENPLWLYGKERPKSWTRENQKITKL